MTESTKHYVIAWTGGYDNPDYAYAPTVDEAWDQARAWLRDVTPEDGTSIDIIEVDPVRGSVERKWSLPGDDRDEPYPGKDSWPVRGDGL